jgi:di/tricarboxylate transporter
VTAEILLVLAIVVAALVFFVTEWLRSDLVALLVLFTLAVTDLLTPAEALAGFSSPAVVTVWAVFILGGALSRTGIGNIVGRQVLRLAGQEEARMIVIIMLTSGLLSAFMNNVGVAALLLPVVMDIARQTGLAPSRLLMPLAFGCLLGGLTTLIGTPPNILVSESLRQHGLAPFGLFDFTPVGLAVLLAGVAFMALAGRRLLPRRDTAREGTARSGRLKAEYRLHDRMAILQVPEGSALAGKTLSQTRLGAALGLHVMAIRRASETLLAPGPRTRIQSRDRLLVEGDVDRLQAVDSWRHLELVTESLEIERLVSGEIRVAEVRLPPGSSLAGSTLQQLRFRERFGANVMAIRRGDRLTESNLHLQILEPGDVLLLQGSQEALQAMVDSPDFEGLVDASPEMARDRYLVQERLFAAQLPEGSPLAGKTLAESRLGDAFDLTVLGIVREDETRLMPAAETGLEVGDTLLLGGRPDELSLLQSFVDLGVETENLPPLDFLESERVGLAEVVLSPGSRLAGKTLREIHFREKYGLHVLAVWREGEAFRTNLRDLDLRFGDALLLYGPLERLQVLGAEPDFLVLTAAAQEPVRREKAPLAALVMAAVILPVLAGWLPIHIAAIGGAAFMVITGCLRMEEAYRAIEWRAVFLIAGMLPLGTAMEQTGAARFLAGLLLESLGDLGPRAVVAGLFLLTALGAQVMPTSAVAVLMAPLALTAALEHGLSPAALLMTVAVSASASFMSPVAHPANTLVMGAGGYRFTDYIKVGFPLTLVILVVVVLFLPVVWPLVP